MEMLLRCDAVLLVDVATRTMQPGINNLEVGRKRRLAGEIGEGTGSIMYSKFFFYLLVALSSSDFLASSDFLVYISRRFSHPHAFFIAFPFPTPASLFDPPHLQTNFNSRYLIS